MIKAGKKRELSMFSPESDKRLVPIGHIRKPHGLRGELKIYPLLSEAADYTRLKFCSAVKGPTIIPLEIERARGSGKDFLIKLKGYDSVESVDSLKGFRIETERNRIPSLPDGEYYSFDILGMRVFLEEDNSSIGTVADIIKTGANDVYVVQSEKKEVLIPAIREVIRRIDIQKREMLIRPLEGMLEDD